MVCLSRVSNSSENVSASGNTPTDDVTVSSEDQELPEGGIAAWCTVLGAFLAQFCGFGYANAFGVYQAFYSQQYLANQTSSSISWIGSLAAFLITGIGLIGGALFDKGYFYPVFIGGAILQSFSLFMLSLAKPGSYYQILLAQGLACGIGQGLMYVPTFAILSHYFKRRRPAMMSIVASGAALGGIVHAIMLNKLLNGPAGFKDGVRISAGFITATLFLSCVLVRPRYDAMHHNSGEIKIWEATKKCFTELPSLFIIIGFTLFQVGYMYPLFYLQVDSLRHGLSASFSFYSLVIVNGGSFLGRSLVGSVLPFIGIVDLTILTTIACAVLIIGMIWLNSVASVVVLGLLYGVFWGMNIALLAPMMGLTSDPAELGARIGMGVAIAGIGGLIGSPVCGALLTSRYIWLAPALFCGVIALVGSAFFVGARVLFARAAIQERECASGESDAKTPCDTEATTEKKSINTGRLPAAAL